MASAASVWLLACLFIRAADSQCTDALDEPEDYSGITPSRQPPVPAGGTVIYHCPGLKSFKNETDWTVTCSPDTSEFEWTPPLLIWPECGCDDAAVRRDMCPELHSIQTNYAHSDGAQAATVLKINMTSNVTDWKVVLKLDMDVATDLGADARGAGMIAKTERELILTKPSAYTSWTAKQEEIRVEYFFDGASAYKWQHPCVASISCEINTADQDQFENTKLWVIMAIVAAIAVVFALICFCIVYAFKHCGSSGGKVEDDAVRRPSWADS